MITGGENNKENYRLRTGYRSRDYNLISSSILSVSQRFQPTTTLYT